jgi:hypothetical protein
MAEAYRHHRALHPTVIFVEVPAAGSPEPHRQVKPGRYPHQDRAPWNPLAHPEQPQGRGAQTPDRQLRTAGRNRRGIHAPRSRC